MSRDDIHMQMFFGYANKDITVIYIYIYMLLLLQGHSKLLSQDLARKFKGVRRGTRRRPWPQANHKAAQRHDRTNKHEGRANKQIKRCRSQKKTSGPSLSGKPVRNPLGHTRIKSSCGHNPWQNAH